MEICFRDPIELTRGEPAAGEVWLNPRGGRALAMATLMIEHGQAALRCGSLPLKRIIVPSDPTLDDMLAATLLVEQLEHRELPSGAMAFARYTALVREGVKAARIPLAASIEGMFLALINLHGPELRQPTNATHFLGAWRDMAKCILAAATSGVDPFTTELFTGAEFARARAFLEQDHGVYQHDVARGEVWPVCFPGAPPRSRALMVREPKSILCKYWSREGAQAFVLLGVRRGAGHWVFSTDPVHRLSLAPLHDLLQSAERQESPSRAADYPWFDGKQFESTLIGAPRAGTALDDGEVLAIVKRWSRVPRPRWRAASVAAAVILVASVVVAVALEPWHERTSRMGGPDSSTINKSAQPLDTNWQSQSQRDQPANTIDLHVLAIGVSEYQAPGFRLDWAADDARDLFKAFDEQPRGKLFRRIDPHILVDRQATKDAILRELKALNEAAGPDDLIVVAFSGHGKLSEYEEQRFFFLPYDYDPAKELATSALSVDDVREPLADLHCKRVLIADTCHSGQISKRLLGSTRGDPSDTAAQEVLRKFHAVQAGSVVFAACTSREMAQEHPDWRHGALTLAWLEAMSGDYLFAGKTATPLPRPTDTSGFIFLGDVGTYVVNRVKELSRGKQTVVCTPDPNIAMSSIPIALWLPR